MPDFLAFATFHIDHVISQKHGGKTNFANLAYACPVCNSYKGTDVGTVWGDEQLVFVPFFNPRLHNWHDHFLVENGLLVPQTIIAQGTTNILRINDVNRIIERQQMQEVGLYP